MFKKITIAFIGNDGTGKTYQTKKVFQKLNKNSVSVKVIHFDHFFLKIPNFASSSKYFSAEGEEDQSIRLFKNLKGNTLFGFFFPFVVYIDFIAFYLFKIIFIPERIIILDRYFYDKLIKFYDLGVCNKIVFRILFKITFCPTITFYFDLTEAESLKRKGEMTRSILRRRRLIYKKVAKDYGFLTIDAGRTKDKILSDIIEKLEYVQ